MKISFNSPVVLLFALVSGVELLLSTITHGAIDSFFTSSSLSNIFTLSGFTGSVLHIFGHASFEHFLGNMMFILLLGPILEEKYSSVKLLFMILITAVATSIINAFLFNGVILGASGIVFMMIVLSSFAGVRAGAVPVTFILVVILYIGKEVYASIFIPSNISHFAHILGGCFGGIFGIMFSKGNYKNI